MKGMPAMVPLTVMLVTSCMAVLVSLVVPSDQARAGDSASAQTQGSSGAHSQQSQQARPEVEQQRQKTEQDSKKTLDKDAIEAIEQTRNAMNAIAAGKNDEALSNLEHATGKIDILLARNPATALVPVNSVIEVIDAAPQDTQAILELAQDASLALDRKDYPTARALLYGLMSEIRDRTYNLPLATYPNALKRAAQLLQQKKTQEAQNEILTALNTLVVIDRVTPIPLLLAKNAINEAQAKSHQDKNAAEKLLETAKNEVVRARELGYAGKDQEYTALDQQISNLEKQLKGNEDLTVAFSHLKDKLSAFLKRQSEQKRGS